MDAAKPNSNPTPVAEKQSLGSKLTPWLFLGPYLLLFIVFMLLPAIAGISISFTHWEILGTPSYAGLSNYHEISADPLFWRSVWNTLYFMILAAIPLVVVGLGLAILLNQNLFGTNIARTIVFMPHVVMVSAVGILWSWLYEKASGMINFYMSSIGLPQIGWLTDTTFSLPSLAITTLWWTVNTNMLIYLAALQDIPEELYEASKLDGAGAWSRFRYITLPQLMPVSALVLSLTVISCWRVFGQAYVMTKGGPETSTFVMVQYIYLTAFQNFQMGPAAAAAVVLLLITLFFSIVQLCTMKML